MKSVAVTVLAALCWMMTSSQTVWAQASNDELTAAPDLVSGKVYNIHGSIVGNLSAPIAGACTGPNSGNMGFATCPTGATCECRTILGARLNGSLIGIGHADIYIDVDISQQPPPVCFPFTAELDLIARRDTEYFSGSGNVCSATKNDFLLIGTFMLEKPSFLFSEEMTYEAFSATGNIDKSGAAFRMHLTGKAQAN